LFFWQDIAGGQFTCLRHGLWLMGQDGILSYSQMHLWCAILLRVKSSFFVQKFTGGQPTADGTRCHLVLQVSALARWGLHKYAMHKGVALPCLP